MLVDDGFTTFEDFTTLSDRTTVCAPVPQPVIQPAIRMRRSPQTPGPSRPGGSGWAPLRRRPSDSQALSRNLPTPPHGDEGPIPARRHLRRDPVTGSQCS